MVINNNSRFGHCGGHGTECEAPKALAGSVAVQWGQCAILANCYKCLNPTSNMMPPPLA